MKSLISNFQANLNDSWLRYLLWNYLLLMSLHFTDNKSILVQVLAWYRQAPSHYLSQCWPRSVSPYGVNRPQLIVFWPDCWISVFQMALLAWLNKGDEGKEMLKLTSQLRVGYELVSRVSGEKEIQAAEVIEGKQPQMCLLVQILNQRSLTIK